MILHFSQFISPAMRSSFSTHLLRSSLSPSAHSLRISSLCARVSVHPNGGVAVRPCITKHTWVCRPQSVQLKVGHRSGFQVAAYTGAKDAAMDAAGSSKQSGNSGVAQATPPSASEEVPATITVSEEMGQLEPKGPDSDVKDGVKVQKSMWSKLGQRVNIAGIQFASRIMLRDRHLAVPHVSVPDIRWVDWKALHDRGFEGVVFDKDNTLTAPYALTVWPALTTSLQECQSVFGGRIALLSNSAGLYQFDPDGVEAKALEERLGIPVIRHETKKPAGTAEDLAKHFNCDPSRLIMVGDRYFTDVVFGNNNGLLTIRPAPLTTIGEPFVVQKVRMFEEAAVGRWLRQKVQPKEHALFTSPHDFIKDSACW
ncbi:hypothetical protein KC19_4G121600 [Ceratodon purpureus]|uniref:Uncharacterized protein n=1 Tax=Ceratodon purpureus TaxID=3225 RepID=A0A8T0IAE7_CERPU|nr:hypothetical protein KC19_4G121600 [Ceratodon purpureus]